MKQLLVALSLALSGILNAQSLQFSQVKLVTNQETVPAGKVWKLTGCAYSSNITGMISTGQGAGVSSNSDALIQINGQNRAVRSVRAAGGYNHASGVVWETHWPLWLPAGANLSAGTGVGEISVIEFTVVP